ncbi:MAG: VWA domain-containing protein, partial [Candidatus Omnitrophica bacterium]|nr:VWA domain-containing protein [Candidatus Omnitrophota bacterium]
LDVKMRELQKTKPRGIYDKYYAKVAKFIDMLFGILDNELVKDKKFRYKGYYSTGPKLHIRKAMTMKKTGDMDIWLRRIKPTKRSFKFSIVLDESGSMGGGRNETSEDALKAIVLLMEVLSRLDIDFSLIGFSNAPSTHKHLGEQFKHKDKDALLSEVVDYLARGGSTYDAAAVNLAVSQLEKEATDSKIIIVVTDGYGNGPVEVQKLIREARKKGIEVIGIGIGAGMAYVKDVYRPHVVVETMDQLPQILAKLLIDIVVYKKYTPVDIEESETPAAKQNKTSFLKKLTLFPALCAFVDENTLKSFIDAIKAHLDTIIYAGVAAGITAFTAFLAVKAYAYYKNRSKAGSEDKFVLGVVSKDLIAPLRARIAAESLTDSIDDVVVAGSPGELGNIAAKRGLMGIFLDSTMTVEAVGSLRLAKDMASIRLKKDLNIVLTVSKISDTTREEIEESIKKILPRIEKVDFERALEEFKRAAARGSLSNKHMEAIERLKQYVAQRKGELKDIYSSSSLVLDKANMGEKRFVAITTEKPSLYDPYTVDKMNEAAANGIVSYIVCDSNVRTRAESEALIAAGSRIDNPQMIKFINKNDYSSYDEMMRFIENQERVGRENMGVRAAKGELLKPGERPGAEKFLEIQEIEMNDIKVYAAINSYQALLEMLTAQDGKLPPGVWYEKGEEIFKYLPRSLPINYGREIEAYRRAALLISAAA